MSILQPLATYWAFSKASWGHFQLCFECVRIDCSYLCQCLNNQQILPLWYQIVKCFHTSAMASCKRNFLQQRNPEGVSTALLSTTAPEMEHGNTWNEGDKSSEVSAVHTGEEVHTKSLMLMGHLCSHRS